MAEGRSHPTYVHSELGLLTPEESPTYDNFGDEIDHHVEIESEIAERARSLAEIRDRGPAARENAHGGMTHSLRQETSAHASQVADGIRHGDSSFRLQAPDISETAERHGPQAASQSAYGDYSDLYTLNVELLKREIHRLQHEIKSISAKRSASIRGDIRRELASEMSTNSNDDAGCTSTARPPRTADKSERVESENRQPRRSGKCDSTMRSDDRPASVVRSTTELAEAPMDVDKPSADRATTGGTVTETAAQGKSVHKPLKLEKFDGVSTPLETFLTKYNNRKRYNQWNSEESAVFLRDSLQSHASQILWEIADNASDQDIVRLLRNRFGNSLHMERFRAQLQTRRRKPGESIQAVNQDIRRLMALGFPGQSGEL